MVTYIVTVSVTHVHVELNGQSISLVIRRLQVVHMCNICSTISVHVAQWLEHLNGHQKVTGLSDCTVSSAVHLVSLVTFSVP